jgi:hypothetical protein
VLIDGENVPKAQAEASKIAPGVKVMALADVEKSGKVGLLF